MANQFTQFSVLFPVSSAGNIAPALALYHHCEGPDQPGHEMASRPGEFHPQALLEPCLNLSVHTAPDVRPLTCSTRQCANRAGFARCIRANQSRAPFGRGRRRLYLFRAQRIR